MPSIWTCTGQTTGFLDQVLLAGWHGEGDGFWRGARLCLRALERIRVVGAPVAGSAEAVNVEVVTAAVLRWCCLLFSAASLLAQAVLLSAGALAETMGAESVHVS